MGRKNKTKLLKSEATGKKKKHKISSPEEVGDEIFWDDDIVRKRVMEMTDDQKKMAGDILDNPELDMPLLVDQLGHNYQDMSTDKLLGKFMEENDQAKIDLGFVSNEIPQCVIEENIKNLKHAQPVFVRCSITDTGTLDQFGLGISKIQEGARVYEEDNVLFREDLKEICGAMPHELAHSSIRNCLISIVQRFALDSSKSITKDEYKERVNALLNKHDMQLNLCRARMGVYKSALVGTNKSFTEFKQNFDAPSDPAYERIEAKIKDLERLVAENAPATDATVEILMKIKNEFDDTVERIEKKYEDALAKKEASYDTDIERLVNRCNLFKSKLIDGQAKLDAYMEKVNHTFRQDYYRLKGNFVRNNCAQRNMAMNFLRFLNAEKRKVLEVKEYYANILTVYNDQVLIDIDNFMSKCKVSMGIITDKQYKVIDDMYLNFREISDKRILEFSQLLDQTLDILDEHKSNCSCKRSDENEIKTTWKENPIYKNIINKKIEYTASLEPKYRDAMKKLIDDVFLTVCQEETNQAKMVFDMRSSQKSRHSVNTIDISDIENAYEAYKRTTKATEDDLYAFTYKHYIQDLRHIHTNEDFDKIHRKYFQEVARERFEWLSNLTVYNDLTVDYSYMFGSEQITKQSKIDNEFGIKSRKMTKKDKTTDKRVVTTV